MLTKRLRCSTILVILQISAAMGCSDDGDVIVPMDVQTTGGVVSVTGGTAVSTGGMAEATGGVAQTGGVTATGGAVSVTGGTDVSTGGMAVSTGGMAEATGGVAETGGVTATGGMAEATGGVAETGGVLDAPKWAMRDDLGEGDGSDVVTIGDSWMSNTLGTGDAIEGGLRRLGKDYRNYGVQGVMLLQGSLFGAAIPSQFATAVRRDSDIKTVIMTGGGNDIIQSPGLQTDCANGGDACARKLMDIRDGLAELWADMAEAGVQDVIYMGYSSDAGSSGEEATSAGKNGVIDACRQAALNCHLMDSTPLVDGQLAADGIHPQRSANTRMAQAIVELMEERKMRR